MSERFAFYPGERIAVMGVGNALCADDGAGGGFRAVAGVDGEGFGFHGFSE